MDDKKEVLNRKCTMMTSLTTAANKRKSELTTKLAYNIEYDSTNQDLLSKIKVEALEALETTLPKAQMEEKLFLSSVLKLG